MLVTRVEYYSIRGHVPLDRRSSTTRPRTTTTRSVVEYHSIRSHVPLDARSSTTLGVRRP
jgi:hypothetical protein